VIDLKRVARLSEKDRNALICSLKRIKKSKVSKRSSKASNVKLEGVPLLT